MSSKFKPEYYTVSLAGADLQSTAMIRAAERNIPEVSEGVLLSLAKMVEERDSHTAGHCERLAYMAVALGAAMGLDNTDLLTLYLGGFLHDVGKVAIPDAI